MKSIKLIFIAILIILFAISMVSCDTNTNQNDNTTQRPTTSNTDTSNDSNASNDSNTSDDSNVSDDSNASDDSNTSSVLKVTLLTESVTNGDYAEITISGKPNTEYKIYVYYGSGPSKEKGLEPNVTDESGTLTWRWRVGINTSAGKHKITISGGNEKIDTYFSTLK